MAGRQVPFDEVAESAALGALILRNDLIGTVMGIAAQDDFYLEKNRVIYEAMRQLADAGQPVDHVTVGGQIAAMGKAQLVGGMMALKDLCDLTVASNAEAYARRVQHLSLARKMIAQAYEVIAEGTSARTASDPLAFIAGTRQKLASIEVDDAAVDKARHIGDIVREVERSVRATDKKATQIKTGIAGIDTRSGGLWPGLLTILAARPGVGKSALLQTIATNVAQSGHAVLQVTLEDLPYVVGVRHLARFADIDNTTIAIGDLSDAELARLDASMAATSDMKYWVLGASNVTSDAIRAAVIKHRAQHGLGLLIVDHLAEIREEAENETQVVSKAARAARDLALELRVPVIYAHQLNRKVEDRNDKRPTMADLKQSGKIEEVARTVWFLYRDGYYTKDATRRDAQLIISKANHGRTGMVRLWADLSRMYYRDWDEATDGRFPKQPGVADGAEVVEAAADDAAPRSKQERTTQWLNASADLFNDRRDLDY